MNEKIELNRLEFMILETLYAFGSRDCFHGMTITEIMEDNDGSLGARMTVYKKMKKLEKAGYIQKGGTSGCQGGVPADCRRIPVLQHQPFHL